MEDRRRAGDAIETQHRLLEAHYDRFGTIPSMAGLAELWGYASKSSAARRVEQFLAMDVLMRAPGRRLAPGPRFRRDGKGRDAPLPAPRHVPAPDEGRIGDAQRVWASDYDPVLARSYSITARLLRVAHGMEREMACSAAREGLSSGDVLLLDALHRAGPDHPLTPTALKHYFLISLAGVGKRLDRLEALGLVRRVPNPSDGRGLYVQLTEEGQAALSRLVEADRTAPHILWPLSLGEEDYRVLLAALDRADAVMGEG